MLTILPHPQPAPGLEELLSGIIHRYVDDSTDTISPGAGLDPCLATCLERELGAGLHDHHTLTYIACVQWCARVLFCCAYECVLLPLSFCLGGGLCYALFPQGKYTRVVWCCV